MDSGPQAYGLGRVSGQVDFQQFLRSRPVLVRLLCLKFSIIAYFCISPGSKVWDEQLKRDVCIFAGREKETPCYVGVQITLLEIVESIIFLCTEYFMWMNASVKIRRRIIRTNLYLGGADCAFGFFVFWYIFFNWVGTSVPDNVSTANPNFAILFLFLDIFAWGYFTLLEYQRLAKGVDPEFTGSFNIEDGSAQFTASEADAEIPEDK